MIHKERRLLLVMIMLLVSALPVGIPLAPVKQAHAVGPSITNVSTVAPTFSGSTLAMGTFTPTASTTLMVYSQCQPNTVAINTITDTAGFSWTKLTSASVASDGTIPGMATEAWWAQIGASPPGSDTVTLNYAPSFTVCTAIIVDISQPSFLDTASGAASLSTTSTFTHSSSGTSLAQTLVMQWDGSGNVVAGCTISGQPSYTINAPLTDSGLTSVTNPFASNCPLYNHLADVFFASAGSVGPWTTTFNCNSQCRTGLWAAPDPGGNFFAASTLTILLTMAPITPITKTVVSPCTFFQLQCWWYPLFFNISFGATYLVVAFMADASTKAEIFMLLSGLSVAGLISIILAVLPITFPLMIIIAQIAYTLRLRGII